MARVPLRPVVALGAIVAADFIVAARRWPRPLVGALDETAHLATGAIILDGLRRSDGGPFGAGLLAGSVLLDLDHVPEAMGRRWLRPRRSVRPYPHTLATPLALTLLRRTITGARSRDLAAGVTAGTCGHLARDLATPLRGGGAWLLWPMSRRTFTAPYAVYLLVLAALALRAARRPVLATSVPEPTWPAR